MKNVIKKVRSFLLNSLVLCSLTAHLNAQTGEALNFGSGSDYIQMSSLTFGTNWTAEAWIRPTNLFGNWNVVLGQAFWNSNQGFVIAVQNGSVFVNAPGSNGVNISAPITSVWTHVAVTYNNGIWAFYKNGMLVGTQIAPFTAASNGFYLGTRKDNTNSSLTDYYSGDMDEVRVWSTTRSQCDIMSYMNCEIPNTATGLVANYHFNQGLANNSLNFILGPFTLADATGNGNTGSLNNFNLTSSGGTSNWTYSGAPAQGISTPTIPSPEINIKGNSVSIADGDASSSTTDFTDFNGQGTRTFVIESTGTGTLNVGIPVFTGANASDFSVTVAPASALAASTGSTSFVVAFTPTSVGTKSAVLNLYNSDCSEPIYDFVITATAVTASALNFDGVNDYVETGANLAELAQADFSMEAWIRTTGTNEAIITCANANTSWEAGEKCFYLDGSGIPMFVGWGNNYIVGNISVNNGAWHHVAVVWDFSGGVSGTGAIYVDGVNHTSGFSYQGNNTNIGTFKIGRTNYNAGEAQNSFAGDIDEVRIWNRVLCLPEIINNMNCELPSPASQVGLNGYYKFNTGIAFGTNTTVTSAPDAAVFANNGTLTNFSLTGGLSSNWVNPGGVTSGSTCSAYLDEEINLQGNSTTINSGDISPSTADHTDFGLVNVGSVLSRTFVIQNVGTAALSISAYSLSGANASDFTITTTPGASVPAAGNTSIVISFSASVTGVKTASLTIANSDCDEGVYRFVINATGVVPGAALNFDGVNDYVQFADPNLGASDFTLEQWIKPTVSQNAYLLTTRTSEGGQAGNWFAVSIGVSGNLALELGGSPGSGAFTANTYTAIGTATNAIGIGIWNHVAVVRAGNSLRLYINGVERANSITSITNTLTTGNNILRFGGAVNFNSQWFNGSLDEIRIWNVARTQCEIQTYMNCEIPTTAAGLVGNYHFNQGYDALSNSTVTTVTDASPSGNTGAVTNFSLTGTNSNWAAPGGVVSGYTTVTAPVAEIDVQGNGNSIADGSTSTSITNFTDFNGVLTRTFTIQNTVGGGTLNIGTLFITGTNASQFSITTLPSASVVGTGSTSFVVAFTPTSTGVKSATININNNDCSEPIYDFVVTATAVTGAALNFDGTDDYVDLGNSGTLKPTSALTAEAWVFSSTWPSVDRTIFGNTENAGYGVFTSATGQLQGLVRRNSSWATVSTPLSSLSAGWHHVALTFDGRYTKLYVDGIFKSLDDAGANYSINYIGNNTLIGGEASTGALPVAGWYFNGSVDELRVWNVERTACEIQSYMNCEIPTTTTGLLANYHFNQGIAGGNNSSTTSLTDFSGNSLNGTLTNMALTGATSNWITPGGVISGSTTPSAPTPTISLSGNSNTILNNSTSPLTSNYTDFGSATTRTFVIQNAPSGTLNILTPLLTGSNASEFSVTVLPSSTLASSGTTSFVVAFTPTTGGTRAATVNIYSNDCNTPLFKFAVQGVAPTGQVLNLDGFNDFVDITHTTSLNAFPITVETWVKTAYTGSTAAALVGKYVSNSSNGWLIYLSNGNLSAFYFNNASNYINFPITATTSITDNNWHHVALVVDATGGRLYVDGIQRSPNRLWTGTPAPPSTTQNVLIGSYDTFLPGSIDEVRIWNTARTQCEIQSYMNCEIPSTAAGLLANYHFNQGAAGLSNSTVTTLSDASGNSNTGTLSGLGLSGATSNWIAPGQVVPGFTTSTAPTATLTVYGNGNPVPMGATTNTNNYTDFGLATNRTFLVHNLGVSPLFVNNIYFSGANASNFSVTSLPSSSIAGSSNSPFIISFSATAVGSQSAIVNIVSNDCSNPTFSFVITASTVPAEALSFNGINDVVDCGTNSSLDITVGTWEAWVKLNDLSDNRRIFFKELSDGNGIGAYESYFLNSDGKFHGDLKIGGTTHYVIGSLTPVVNTWYHVAATYDGVSFKLYVNGVLDGITTSPSGPMNPGTGHLSLGAAVSATGSSQMDGSIDEARLWNVARTQCEIQTYMNCEIPGTSPGLIANYHFNQGVPSGSNTSVTTLTDATGNNPATLVGFSLTGGSVSNWVSPSQITSGYTTAATPNASISLSGNSNPIVNNSTTPLLTNFTDFGTASTRTFVIQNGPSGTLNLAAPFLTGTNASEFSVTVLPSLSLSASGTTSFVVAFSPTTGGTRSATVNIYSNDCATPIFNFKIQGIAPGGEALNFNGSGDNITTASSSALAMTNAATLEGWFKTTSSSGMELIRLFNASNQGVEAILSGGQFSFNAYLGSWLNYSWNTGPFLNDGNWHHYAITVSGNTATAYIDGLLAGAVTGTASLNTGNASLYLGRHPGGGSFFNGLMDEVRVWNVAKTQCDIQTFMNCEIPTTASGLVANYHFNQGAASLNNSTVTTLVDAAGSNTGNLNSFSLLTGTVSNWVAPGKVVPGFTTSTLPSATLSITGNGNAIAAGSTSPLLSNFTDFGTNTSRTFVLQSTGGGTMYINTPVIIGGANAGDFSVTSQPSSSITTGTSSFVINFIPTAVGSRSAIVVVNSSDCTSPNYSFVITASATAAAALNFDGTDDYASTSVFNTQTTDITLQTRVYWNGVTGNNKFIIHSGNSGSSGYGMYIAASSGSVYAIYAGQSVFYSGFNLTPNQWTSLTMVIETNKLSFYANGVLTTTVAAGNPYPPVGTFNIGVGLNQGTENFNGSIDEVLLWGRPLTQCEIAAYQNCEIATTGSSLIANYHFNQGIASGVNTTVTTLTDASGNSNNLSLSNYGLSGMTSNWITPGAVTSGSSCPAFSAPEINVVSNALTIPDGNTVTTISDNTDFGNISSTGNIARTYTIQNTGGSNLAVTTISMSGADAGSFTISALSPASPVSASNSAVFSITFAPTSIGTKSAIVNIINNDCDESTYDFVVTGTSTTGAAFNFDGTDDYINCGNILTASYTKEAWVKFSTSSNGNNFLSAGAGTNGSALWAPGLYNYSLSAGHDGAWNQVQDNVAMVPGNWYHIAVTYDAPSLTMILYKNGVAVSTNTNVPPFTGTNPLHIGAFSGTFVATGSIDEVRIWNRPLCQAEIQNNMNCEISGPAQGLIANYQFNQGVANGSNTAITSLTDASGNSNNGTLTNIANTGTISNWIATSTVTSGSSCAAYFTPEINVVGNNQTINDGDITPSATDNTDFGGVCVNGLIVKTFTIQNTGTANLTVSSITLSGTSAGIYTVGALSPASPITPSNQAVFTVSFSPTSSGVKTATVNITNNDCNENPYDFVITGTCNALPVVTATTTNSVICNGASTSLSGLGADTYTWSGSVVNGVSFTPSVTGSYSVIGTNTLTGCTSTNSAVLTITVNANPTITASSSHTVICNGFLSPTLTANGAGTSGTYTWNPGANTGSSVSPSPSSTTVYSVSATSSAGCLSTNTVAITVSVNALPTVTALTTNSVICINFTTSLNGAGADTYTWTGGAINGQTFAPTSTQSYSVTGTNTLTGCTSTNSAIQTITVNPLPVVSISLTNSVICQGTSATLTASGANTYTWIPGSLNGVSITPSPSVFTTYSLIGTSSSGCTSTNTSVQSISVNPIPTVTASVSASVVCSGNTITLNGSGAMTYTWSNGVTDGTPFVPGTSGTYTLNGTNVAGCTNTNLATVSVTVNALPQLSVTVTNPVICFGNQSTLNGSGASTYTWSGGIVNNTAFTPTATSDYTLSATDANNCQNTSVITITVNALPLLTVSSTSSISCEAQSTTLSVSGASSYSWDTGANTSSIVITPTTSTTFTINATDVNSCTNTVVYTQSVAPCPGTFSAWVVSKNVSCTGKDDGSIAVKYSTSYINPQLSYVWHTPGVCAGTNCDSISKLAAGRYGVTVKITYTLNSILVKTDSVVISGIDITDANGICEVKVFTGISANKDGINDVMIIENIEEFPNNKVTVFNRWGQLVFEKKGYNNTDIAWPAGDEADKLTSNTYFYVIDLGNGSKIIKGWVELIKN